MPIVQNRFGKRSLVSELRAKEMIDNDGAILIEDETPPINANTPSEKVEEVEEKEVEPVVAPKRRGRPPKIVNLTK